MRGNPPPPEDEPVSKKELAALLRDKGPEDPETHTLLLDGWGNKKKK